MELAFAILKLIGGFALLIVGGEALVASAVSIAARFKISPAVVGLTIIAAGTSAPEMLTSVIAALEGTPDIAMGNVVGSNIFNILAILSVSAFLVTLKADRNTLRRELPVLILFSFLFYLSIQDQLVSRMEGGIAIFILIAFLGYTVMHSKKHDSPTEGLSRLKNQLYEVGYLIVGMGALIGGAKLALDGGIDLGTIAGLSQRTIGITIISAGTGLPELATSAVAAYKGRNDIAISNVIGSNLMNTLGVTGMAALATPIAVSKELAGFDTYLMLAVTLLLWPALIIFKNRISRRLGVLMLLTYISYISLLVLQ